LIIRLLEIRSWKFSSDKVDFMIIDAQIVTPYLIFVLSAALGLAGFYFKSITNKLSSLSGNLANLAVEIATLIEHIHNNDNEIIDIKKYHNEIIDLKVAAAELNERSKNTRTQVELLQTRLVESK